jgi:ribosomal protein L19
MSSNDTNQTFDRFQAGDRVRRRIGSGRLVVSEKAAKMDAREGVVLSVIKRRTGRKTTASMRTYVQVKWDKARTESWHGVNRLEKVNMLTEDVN